MGSSQSKREIERQETSSYAISTTPINAEKVLVSTAQPPSNIINYAKRLYESVVSISCFTFFSFQLWEILHLSLLTKVGITEIESRDLS